MKYLFNLLILLLAVTGCTGRRPGDDAATKGPVVSATQAQVTKNIDELAEKPWNRAAYDDILNNQILASKTLTKSQREVLRSKLNMYYSRSIVSDMNRMMGADCEKYHSRLAQAAKELRAFKLADGAYDVLRRYEHHQAEIAFAATIGSKQKVSSWKDEYDTAGEKRVRADVEKHRAQKPSCAYLQRAFRQSNVYAAFNKRRAGYAVDLARKYSERRALYDKAEERAVKIRIGAAISPMPEEAEKLIEQFKRINDPANL